MGKRSEVGGVVGGDGDSVNPNSSSKGADDDSWSKLDFRIGNRNDSGPESPKLGWKFGGEEVEGPAAMDMECWKGGLDL